MDLENRTVKITQTGFKCPIDDNRLEYTQIKFNVNNGQWNYYFCQHCKAVYDKTDEEYLMKKAREHLSLLQEMLEKNINVILSMDRIREILESAESRGPI